MSIAATCDAPCSARTRAPILVSRRAHPAPEAAAMFERFQRRAATADGDPQDLWDSFPYDEVASRRREHLGRHVGDALSKLDAGGEHCSATCGVSERMHDETLAIHGGYAAEEHPSGRSPDLPDRRAPSSSTPTMPARSWTSRTKGFHYNRINNPTVDVLEQRLNALEGGAAAMAVSSGAAAVSMSALILLSAGDNLVFGAAAVRSHLHLLRARPPPHRHRGPLRGRRSGLTRSPP